MWFSWVLWLIDFTGFDQFILIHWAQFQDILFSSFGKKFLKGIVWKTVMVFVDFCVLWSLKKFILKRKIIASHWVSLFWISLCLLCFRTSIENYKKKSVSLSCLCLQKSLFFQSHEWVRHVGLFGIFEEKLNSKNFRGFAFFSCFKNQSSYWW